MKHTTRARTLAAFVALVSLGAATLAVNAQTPPGPPGGPPPGPSSAAPQQPATGVPGALRMPATDAEFVRALDRANSAELELAKYVVNRTKDPAVHAFAQHMIEEHSTAAVKLEAATRGTNLRPTPRDDGSPPPAAARALALLQSDAGPKMDEDYMRMQDPAHRRVLGLLQWESQNGTNANLKALATNLAPTVQQHLQLAQQYLALHHLTPLTPPDVLPVPGNVNPSNSAGPGPGTEKNPAATPASPGPSGSPKPY